jgi:hypothetical protein
LLDHEAQLLLFKLPTFIIKDKHTFLQEI